MSVEFLRSDAFKHFIMEYTIGLFNFSLIFIFPFLQVVLHAVAIPDFLLDNNEFETDTASYDPEIFDQESSSLTSLLGDTDDSNTALFESSIQDGCPSLMSAEDSNLFSTGQDARLRPREESCPNPGSSKPEIGLQNFGLFNPGSALFNLVNPPGNPLKPPTQVFPEPPEQDPIRKELDRIFLLPDVDHRTDVTNNEDDPCPSVLVSDLDIPVCDSGDYARDVLRIAGEYFFDLFNIRYCVYVRD